MSNYILNIDKLYSTSTPQIVGRVADLPYMDFEFRLKDGDKPLDLTGCTVEFRGLTSTGHKIISANSVKVTSAKNGTIDFKIPENFYSSPGRFKRAYFAIKKSGRIDTTQDIIIHVLDSVDMDAQDAQDVIDAVDKIIADVEKQVKSETNRLIQQIKNDTASTIADSNKKLADLDKQINDFKTNTNSTISQINGELLKLNSDLSNSNSKLNELNKRLDSLSENINDKNLATLKDLDDLSIGHNNLLIDSEINDVTNNYNARSILLTNNSPKHGELVTIYIKGSLGSDRTSFSLYNSGGSISVTSITNSDKKDGIFKKTFPWVAKDSSGREIDSRYINLFQIPSSGQSSSTLDWIKLVRHNPGNEWVPSIQDSYFRSISNVIKDSNFNTSDVTKYWVRDGVETSKESGYLKLIPIGGTNMRIYNRSELDVLYGNHISASFVAYSNKNCTILVGTYNDKKEVNITTSPTRYYIDGIPIRGSSRIPSIFTNGNVVFIREISFTVSQLAQSHSVSSGDVDAIYTELEELKKAITALGGS